MNEAFLDALPVGYRLHWYVIERVLGQGGFGITHLALDTNLDRYVAIKEYLPVELARRRADGTVQPHSEANAEQYAWGLDRFLAEARTLARFDHPNIVRVFSVFEANGTAYMVMRFEEGEDLATRLERCGTLDERGLMGCLLPVLDGLRLVHDAGYIHRDIKPENIYLRHDGSPVLLDFGSARQSLGPQKAMTILVAPGYAPLEQYHGDAASQGPWTDIYSLGATCYRSITGQAPRDAVARAKGVLGSTRELLKPASEIGAGRYTPRLLAAVDWALQLAERDRPQSIAEWRHELSGSGDAPPTAPALDPTVVAPAAQLPRVPLAMAPQLPHVPLAVASPAAPLPRAAVPQQASQPDDRRAPASPPARRMPFVWGAIAGAGTLAAGAALMVAVHPTGAPAPPQAAVLPALPAAPAQDSILDKSQPAPVSGSRPPLPTSVAQPALPQSLASLPPTVTPTAAARARAQTPALLKAPLAAPAPAASGLPALTVPVPVPVPAAPAVQVPAEAPAVPPAPALTAAPPTLAAEMAPPPAAAAAQRPAPGGRSASDDQLAAAESALSRREFAAAADVLTPLAQAGLTRAQALLGRAHESRGDRQRSDFEAYLWYGIAARGGDGLAQAQRDRVAARLQPAEVRQANQIIERWKPGDAAAYGAPR